MPTDFKYWRNLIKETVESIADENYQREEWFNNAKKTWFFPTEMFCKFFDDAAAAEYFDREDTGLNQQQIGIGKNLVALMRQLSNKYPKPDNEATKLIDDPLMIKCREVAKELLKALN